MIFYFIFILRGRQDDFFETVSMTGVVDYTGYTTGFTSWRAAGTTPFARVDYIP
jgi:hypothetical protein